MWPGACHRTQPPPESSDPTESTTNPPAAAGAPQRFEVIDVEDSGDRWLFVEKMREGAAGGWATGSFDRTRNKLEIKTRDVGQFALHLDRVPINWDKLVVLSIDGKNSELRRRESSRLHIQLDDYGQWRVIEP